MKLSFAQTSVMKKWKPDHVANGKQDITSIRALEHVRHSPTVVAKVLEIDLKIEVNVNLCA